MKRVMLSVLLGTLMVSTTAFVVPAKGQAGNLTISIGQTENADLNQPAAPDITISSAEQSVTRAEFVASLVRSLGFNLDHYRFLKAPQVSDLYDDVAVNSPYAKDIMIAGYSGIIGTNEREFRPLEPLDRAEAADYLINALLLKVKDVNQFKPAEQSFQDLTGLPAQVQQSITLASGLNLMSGNQDGNFQPEAAVSGADAIAAIDRLTNLIQSDQKHPDDVTYNFITGSDGNRQLELDWGQKPSSGYTISITNMEMVGDTLYVTYKTTEPSPDSINLSVITEPKDTKDLPAGVWEPKQVILKKM